MPLRTIRVRARNSSLPGEMGNIARYYPEVEGIRSGGRCLRCRNFFADESSERS